MILASDEVRDVVAEAIGSFLGWMFGPPLLVILGLVAVLFLVFKTSVLFGRKKLCWRCKGKGYRKAPLGGVNECSACGGKGIRPRIGVGR